MFDSLTPLAWGADARPPVRMPRAEGCRERDAEDGAACDDDDDEAEVKVEESDSGSTFSFPRTLALPFAFAF